ncbi:MAG: alpha/beta hydrolase [Clostridiales bacterium]|nr:alpha/beta hydrolase [Clostridiales bacterium]
MSINKLMRYVLKVLSYPDVDIKKTYKIERSVSNIRADKLMNPIHKKWDKTVFRGDKEINVRVYTPKKEYRKTVLLFFHGGGWVKENVDSYNSVCKSLSKHTGCKVLSVEYSLAPENPFPEGLEDCYTVTQKILEEAQIYDLSENDIVIIGDSAGGNLAAVVSLLSRDRKAILVKNQILIYPATYNDHSENSPFKSVKDNGTDYLLTSKRVCDYMKLYMSEEEDRNSPYFAPLLAKNLENMPKTLIITAEFDLLRDEGEEFGKRLKAAGNDVKVYRMKDALHGFFGIPSTFYHVKKIYSLINVFLDEI